LTATAAPQVAAARPVSSVTLPDVAKPVSSVVVGTPVAHPVSPAAVVEDVVRQEPIVTWLMVNADAARPVQLAPVTVLRAPLLVTFPVLGKTSAARPDTSASVTLPTSLCAVSRAPTLRRILQRILLRQTLRRRLLSHPRRLPPHHQSRRRPLLELQRRYSLPQLLPGRPRPRPRVVLDLRALRHLLFRSVSMLSSPCSLVLEYSSTSPKEDLRFLLCRFNEFGFLSPLLLCSCDDRKLHTTIYVRKNQTELSPSSPPFPLI